MSVSKAIEILKKGGIVIFPTDTAFGIVCRVDDYEAVKAVILAMLEKLDFNKINEIKANV